MVSYLDGTSWFTIFCYLVTFFFLKRIVWIPFKLYVLAQLLPGVRWRETGQWAVVTGSTDGIGLEYARVLAQKGLDIILISRSEEKLDKVKRLIINDFHRQVKTIQADFSCTDIYDKIAKEIDGLDIGVLVNNVGMANKNMRFQDLPNIGETAQQMINVNCMSALMMTSLVLPGMSARGRGVIIDISSCLSYVTHKNKSIYSATKSFMAMLGNAIRAGCKDTPGIIIQTQTPAITATKILSDFFNSEEEKQALKFTVSTKSFVGFAINTVGWADTCDGHPVHWFIGRVVTLPYYL